MSAKDTFHDAVVKALRKDGWTVTHDPLLIRFAGAGVRIDPGAERLIAAEKSGRKIAVGIKSFLGSSAITEFHKAVGQFMNYRLAMEYQEPERILYLAVPKDAYDSFFASRFAQIAVRRYEIGLIIYHPEKEVIVKWQTQKNTESVSGN